jgi:hypothetical protein
VSYVFLTFLLTGISNINSQPGDYHSPMPLVSMICLNSTAVNGNPPGMAKGAYQAPGGHLRAILQ